jgi:hypothetical protein
VKKRLLLLVTLCLINNAVQRSALSAAGSQFLRSLNLDFVCDIELSDFNIHSTTSVSEVNNSFCYFIYLFIYLFIHPC